MSLNLAKLDSQMQEKIKRWESYRQTLAADPEFFEFLQGFFHSNGSSDSGHRETAVLDVHARPTLTNVVLAVINASEEPLTHFEVRDRINDYPFTGDPLEAVRRALRSLAEQGRVRVTRRGSGTTPNRYARLKESAAA
jgi:hypothetical protein